MGRVDSLSKRVDWAEEVERDNKNQVMLKKEWLEVRAMEQLVEGPEQEIVRKIKEVRDKDKKVIKAVEEMKNAGVKTLRDEEQQIEKGLVLKEGRAYCQDCKKWTQFLFSFSFLFSLDLFSIIFLFLEYWGQGQK